MNILETIKTDPTLNTMYQTFEWSFIVDTLTPAQILYLYNNPEELHKWKNKVSKALCKAITARVQKTIDITPDEWGKVLQETPVTTQEIPEIDTSIHVIKKVKGVKICLK